MTTDELKRVAQLLAADRAQVVRETGSVQLGNKTLTVQWSGITEAERALCEAALRAYTWPTNFPADPVATPSVASIADPVIRGATFAGTWVGIAPSLEWGPATLNQTGKETTSNLLWTLRQGAETAAIQKSKEITATETVTRQVDQDMAAAATLPSAPENGKVNRVTFAKDETGRFQNTSELREATKVDTGWVTFPHEYLTAKLRVLENATLAEIAAARDDGTTGYNVTVSVSPTAYPSLFTARFTAAYPGNGSGGDNWNDYESLNNATTEEQYHEFDGVVKRRTRTKLFSIKQTKSRATAYTFAYTGASSGYHITPESHVEIYAGGTRFRAICIEAEDEWGAWA